MPPLAPRKHGPGDLLYRQIGIAIRPGAECGAEHQERSIRSHRPLFGDRLCFRSSSLDSWAIGPRLILSEFTAGAIQCFMAVKKQLFVFIVYSPFPFSNEVKGRHRSGADSDPPAHPSVRQSTSRHCRAESAASIRRRYILPDGRLGSTSGFSFYPLIPV